MWRVTPPPTPLHCAPNHLSCSLAPNCLRPGWRSGEGKWQGGCTQPDTEHRGSVGHEEVAMAAMCKLPRLFLGGTMGWSSRRWWWGGTQGQTWDEPGEGGTCTALAPLHCAPE